MTPLQSIIEQAAERRGGNSAFDIGWQQGFNAGGEFATTSPSVLKEILKPFAEWLKYQSVQNPEETLKRYLHHLETKQKEDEKNKRNGRGSC